MRSHWSHEDFNHIPWEVKKEADEALTSKFIIEKELKFRKDLLEDAVYYAYKFPSSIPEEMVDELLKTNFDKVLQLYLSYYFFKEKFESLLWPYRSL